MNDRFSLDGRVAIITGGGTGHWTRAPRWSSPSMVPTSCWRAGVLILSSRRPRRSRRSDDAPWLPRPTSRAQRRVEDWLTSTLQRVRPRRHPGQQRRRCGDEVDLEVA